MYPFMKVLMVAPTKPLCQQHYETILKEVNGISEDDVLLLTGSLRKNIRSEKWEKAHIIVATPQTVESMINSGMNLSDICLLIIDEAHRSVGNYSYVHIVEHYSEFAKKPLILGLTASPGGDLEKIRDIIENLKINAVEIRSYNDEDVKPYIHQIELEWIGVDLPQEYKKLQEKILGFIKDKIKELKEKGVKISSRPSKRELLELQQVIRRDLSKGFSYGSAYIASLLAVIIKMSYALELLESQGLKPFYNYLKKLLDEGTRKESKAAASIVKSVSFKEVLYKAGILINSNSVHPKIDVMLKTIKETLKKNKHCKIIIFTQYRDTAQLILESIEKENINGKIFVGQQKKKGTGLSQKEQKRVIEDFRNNLFNVLVSTSIGEEGLDIPEVDLVLFYEPIPSIIRHIQRRGRTGRHKEGRVIILYTKKSIDEAYRWTVYHKYKEMFRSIHKLANEMKIKNKEEEKNTKGLLDFIEDIPEINKKEGSLMESVPSENIDIIIDYREKNSSVVKNLLKKNLRIKFENLPVGDFVIGPVVIELKTIPDFVASIIDNRLIDQLSRLIKEEKPILLIQGEEDLYSVRKVKESSINGMLSSIAIDYGIPILWTKNPTETASLLEAIVNRFKNRPTNYNLHPRKPIKTKELQEYVVSSLPGIGSMLAKRLLKRFKTIKGILEADIKELQEIEGIGKLKAVKIKEVLESEWKEE